MAVDAAGPLFHDPKRLLLDMAREHGLANLLRLVVDRLAASPRVALARIWLVQKSEDCTGCPMLAECPDRSLCLHLAASAGRSRDDPRVEWTRTDGAFRRFPLGVRKVGRIASTGEPVEAPNLWPDPPAWSARPEWMRAEGVAGFGGQPLVHRGQTLGVLAVFARGSVGGECMDWLRTIADHTAAAIATARAFEEIDGLRKRLEEENEYLREEVTRTGAFGELVGEGPALGAVARQIDLVAPTDSAVLVLGESGTGKELVARELHRRSKRAGKPLVKVNCAAVPRELYESEFFGHARGAFTGALRDRAGRFELADGGTLFLDEVGEIPLELQAKLLRVLQEGELERVGEEKTRRVNVRLVAATNRDLRAEAEAGRFRQDLYYRLSVFPVELPPLRKRTEDVPLLAEHFLAQTARKLGRPAPRLTLAAVRQLQQYPWPGNVRELQHVIERAVITAEGGRLAVELPHVTPPPPSKAVPAAAAPTGRVLTDAEVRQLEADNIRSALAAAGGKVSGPGGAAERLGLRPTTLASRMKALGLGRRVE
ncbi:MAG TPA: sigma 54-interacting transcriptional regulator [Urbifossiella sp.]|jgi:transcriptional regulator with GAF, ATPase, and Fis domain|nr:sigma 54-interacting transcriptional regulator [Urbifossiella sp.]